MLVLVCLVVVGWFVLLVEEYVMLGKYVVVGVVFVFNIFFWCESGYFDVIFELKFLLYFWLFGVEE